MHLRLGISLPSRCKCTHYFPMHKNKEEKKWLKAKKKARKPDFFLYLRNAGLVAVRYRSASKSAIAESSLRLFQKARINRVELSWQ